MRSRRKVTLQPIGMPSRSLNCAIDFLALVITGFWPAICCISAAAGLDLLLVLGRLADAHVDDDLVEPRHLEPVLVAELLGHRLDDALVIVALQARRVGPSAQPSIISPDLAATRTFLPSARPRSGRGVGLAVLGVGDRDLRHVQRRFLALDPALRVDLATACGGARATLTPDTTTLPSLGIDRDDFAGRPLSLPDRTTTLSPLRIFAAAITAPPAQG